MVRRRYVPRLWRLLGACGSSSLTHPCHPQISFVRQSGRPRLFLSNDGRPASATHFSAASPEDATSNAVVPALCAAGESQCTLDVAVVGDEASASTYTVQATLPDTTTELETGIASIGTVSAGAYTYFSWQSPAGSQGKAISFTVTAYAGDPDLFVSTAPNPTRTNSYWSSVQYSNDQVEIGTTNEPHRCTAPCEYYIGVYGAGSVDSRFSVLAYYMDQTATLNDGQPQVRGMVVHQLGTATPPALTLRSLCSVCGLWHTARSTTNSRRRPTSGRWRSRACLATATRTCTSTSPRRTWTTAASTRTEATHRTARTVW